MSLIGVDGLLCIADDRTHRYLLSVAYLSWSHNVVHSHELTDNFLHHNSNGKSVKLKYLLIS